MTPKKANAYAFQQPEKNKYISSKLLLWFSLSAEVDVEWQ